MRIKLNGIIGLLAGGFIFLTIVWVMLSTRIEAIETMQTDTLNELMVHRQLTENTARTSQESELVEVKLSATDREYIERVVMAEDRGGGVVGMMAVAQTIRNRGDLWDSIYIDEAVAEGQYAEPYQGEISAEAVQAVWAVFDEGMNCFDEPTTHFHAADTKAPTWAESKVCRGTVGGNTFYY